MFRSHWSGFVFFGFVGSFFGWLRPFCLWLVLWLCLLCYWVLFLPVYLFVLGYRKRRWWCGSFLLVDVNWWHWYLCCTRLLCFFVLFYVSVLEECLLLWSGGCGWFRCFRRVCVRLRSPVPWVWGLFVLFFCGDWCFVVDCHFWPFYVHCWLVECLDSVWSRVLFLLGLGFLLVFSWSLLCW